MAGNTPKKAAAGTQSPKPSSKSSKPSTPTSSRPASRTSSANALAPRGPTPASSETSYHTRLRSLLLEHKKCRKEWAELVIRGLVGRMRAVIELWTEIESGTKVIERGEVGVGEGEQKKRVKASYLFAQSEKLGEQLAAVNAVAAGLAEVMDQMTSVSNRTEHLVVEASTIKDISFAFREPLWVTWPLARFSDGILELTAHYRSSLTLIESLLQTLTSFPPLPSPTVAPSAQDKKDATERPKSEEIQAAMTLLAVQPLLPGRHGDEGPEAWEEIMAVEVRDCVVQNMKFFGLPLAT